METIADFIQLIEVMRSELGQQVIAVKWLAVAFAESDIQLIRHDQVACLRILKSRILREVENIKRIESAAQSRATKRALFGGAPAAFTFGSLLADAIGLRNAPQFGVKLMLSTLSRKSPFGTVLIAIGKEGLPEDLKVIPLSLWARESNKSELEVEASLKRDGYLLVTPEQFAELLDRVEQAVLDGSVSLPIVIDEIIEQIK